MKTFFSKDGTPIAYRQLGSGAPLVLLHGTAGDHSAWSPVLAALAEHFRVLAMDRRGRGGSGDAPAYALAREAEDIAAMIDVIGEPVHLLGHSFGGLCSLEAALLTTGIDKLVLYEPPLSLAGSGWSDAMGRQMQTLLAAGEHEATLLLFFRDITKASNAELAALRAGTNWPARVEAASTVLRELQAIDRYAFEAERFRELSLPTLLLLGSESPPRRRLIAETLRRSLPNSRVAVLEGQQHGAMRTAPVLFVDTVVAFLAGESRMQPDLAESCRNG
jgi:pimeloyl-ACP methyl ester carboxylesterase